ncbi:hypothetical protein QC820_06315 [Halomonas mongoliensis]|uniref:Uncharacterized protein n=1 Tax=Halomonas mongoliensis TaxID=321265 RepID=A0ABU1GK93_9GAMM|nr:hypothetical protein [Halomonas mongoliensis]MDR5892426.1 hypothetical protein [Halomonas mongoliensis]
MERGLTGHYVESICQAFIPDLLPPRPALALDGKLQGRINQAMLERIKAEKAKQKPAVTRRGGRKATVTS